MGLNLEDLKEGCFEIARSNMFERHPISAKLIQDLSDELFHIAKDYAELYHEIGTDADIINRSVWYLAQVHSGSQPTTKKGTVWFKYMLEALLELALPNTLVAEGKPNEFLNDLMKGIKDSIENTFDPNEK